jgi:O-methyltransferase involved in polyketide biosynthesis
MIGSSLLEPSWLEGIPGDLPAMIVAEGVMMYLPASGGGPLLARLGEHFPSGRMTFDALSTAGARMAGADKAVKATGAEFGWGLDDP